MHLHLVLGLIACIVGWLYLRWLKIKRYWTDRGVPHLPPVPIVGSLTFIQRENVGVWLRRLSQHFKSPYVGIWFFWRPGLIINSPKLARNILVRDFDTFRNRFMGSGPTDPIGAFNLFTVNDPIWTKLRRQLSGVFTGSKLRMLQEYMQIKSKELVKRINNDRDIKVDLKALYVDYTTDIIGTSAFGVKSDVTLTGAGPLRDITNEFSKYDLYRGISWCSIYFFPELVDIFRFKLLPKSSTDYFRKIFRAISSQRETDLRHREAKDLLDVLLKLQRENESYTDDFIIAQATIFLLGGYEAAGTLLTYTTYELAYNPDIQDKLYQEIFEAAERNGSENFDLEVLSSLTYLDCVFKEGLRKYSTLTWLDRIAAKDYKVDDNLTIEAGTVIYINIFGMQYDPKYFPEPHMFNPDRFLPENKNKIEPYAYIPFGEGPRACIGKKFGMMTAQFALTAILLNYKIRPLPNMPKPADIKIDNRGLLFLPGEELHVEFVPRK